MTEPARHRTAAIIRAHLGSSRLPGKVILPIAGQPALAQMIARVRAARDIDMIIVATTERHCDLILSDLAARLGVKSYRGSEDDVMARVLGAARAHSVDTIVDVTSDCPLADPDVIGTVLDYFNSHDVDYASNVLKRTYPRGLDVQVYSTDALARAESRTQDRADREHVTLHLYENPDVFNLGNVSAPKDLHHPEVRLTLDTPEDYFVIREIFESLLPLDPVFSYGRVMAFLKDNPQILPANRGIPQKAPRAYDHTARARQALGLD